LQKINDLLLYQNILSGNYVIPVFIHNYKYHIIKNYALDSNLLTMQDGKYYDVPGRTETPYEERRCVISGVFQNKTEEDSVFFLFNKNTYFTNTNEQLLSVEMDINDGNGYHVVSFNIPKLVIFGSDGEKDLKLKISTTGVTYYTIYELSKVAPACIAPYPPDIPSWPIFNPSISQWSIQANIPYNDTLATGNAYLKYSYDGKLDKPFILVEGIDFNDTETHNPLQNGDLGWCGIFGGGNNATTDPDYDDYFFLKKYPTLIENLRIEGYDIILLDFYDGADYVQRNSMLLVKLINLVRDNMVGDQQIVVAGASMGGQIARYALSYMENHNMPHCARMYISMDSPHKGSNIPPGLQLMMKFLSDNALEKISEGAERTLNKTLARPAAKQLTNYQVIQNAVTDFHDPYYAELTALGYPQKVRRVGIANGTRNAVGLGFSDGDLLFEFTWDPVLCLGTRMINNKVYATPGNPFVYVGKVPGSLSGLIACLAPVILNPLLGPIWCTICATGFPTSNVIIPSSTAGWDRAPGGKRRTLYQSQRDLQDKWDAISLVSDLTNPTIQAHYDHHSFIPTISALDINTNDLFYSFDPIVLPSIPGMTPFQAIYAPPNVNEQHSEATDDNIEFVMKEVLNGEYYLQSPLSSFSLNNGVFNFAHPSQKFINPVQIQNGGKLYVNAKLPANYGQSIWGQPVYYPIAGSTLELCTNECVGKEINIVEIQNNGQMILGEAISPDKENKAIVRFKSGSTLKIGTGGKLKINNNSKLIIEPGATIIIEQNAQIELNGTNAVLEIQGTTEIGDNAIFTFTGTGFIRYNVPSRPDPSIKVGTNSQIYFTGLYQKVLEIKGSMLWPEDGLKLFKIEKGEIDIDYASYLNLGCPYQFYSCNFSGGGKLTVWGAANSFIADCEFDGIAIIANQNTSGNIFKMSGSTVKNISGEGLITIGAGAKLSNVNFETCGTAWLLGNPWFPCTYNTGTISNAAYGIANVNSSYQTELSLNKVNISGSSDAIYQSNGTLSMKCCNITGNGYGVYLADNASLNISTATITKNGGYNNIYNNVCNIYLERANDIYMDEGFNNLYAYYWNWEDTWKIIQGTLNYNSCPLPPIIANNNRWYSSLWSDPNPLAIPTQYKFDIYNSTYTCKYTVIDNAPMEALCGAYDSPNPPFPYANALTNALKVCNNCTVINTSDFQNIKYNEAIKIAVANMETVDSTKNDLTAIALFKQILMTPLDSNNAEMLWLANFAFTKMNTALSNAFANGRITVADNATTLHPSVQAVLDVHNRFSTAATADNYIQQFYLDMSKAQIYRLAGRRDLSIQKFNAIQNCFLDEPELKQLNNWKKLTTAENLVLTGQVPREKFDSLYKAPVPVLTKPTTINNTATIDTTATIGQHVTIGANTTIEQGVIIEDNVTIGNNVEIKKDVVVGKGSIIGDSVMINKSVTIGKENSIGNNVKIKKECVFGEKVQLKNNVDLDEGIKLGSMVIIETNTKLKKTVFIADGSNIGSNGNFEKEVKIGNNVITGSNVNLKLGVNIGDRSFIGNNVTVNANAVIGSDAVINNNIVIGSNAKVCDGKTASSNLANNGKIGTCISPSLPSAPMQVDYNCAFALYRAKITGNFFNGFTAENADTSKHALKSGNAITFKANTVSVDYFWDFGDCTTSTEESPAHIYSNPGIYAVTLIQTIKCVPKTTTGAITILPETKPQFNVIASANCFSDNIFRLDKNNTVIDLSAASCFTNTALCKSFALLDSSQLRIKFNWDFGTIRQPLEEIFTVKQIATNTDSILKCFATQQGKYPISLKATLQKKDIRTNLWVNTDCSGTYYDTLNIRNISAGFTVPQYSCLYDTIKFVNNTSGGESPFTYQWNFGNGESSAQENPSVVFGMAGQYAVQMVVSDYYGCSDTSQQTITINPPFIVSFDAGTAVCLKDTLYLNNTTSIPNPSCNISISYRWYFGNSDESSSENPQYVYSEPGTYTVKLVASDEHGFTDTASKTITVYALPVSGISNDTTINKCGEAYLSVNSGYTYLWSPGKYLNDSTIANPVAWPDKTTMFTVLITDIMSGCTIIDTVIVYVQDIPVVFSGNQNNSSFGYTVFTESDFNRDGINDIIIGTMFYDSYGKVNNGCVNIFYGDTDFTNKSFADADLVLYGEVSDYEFGSSLSSADINNDGLDDLIVGARSYKSNASPYPGFAYIYLGSSSGISHTYNTKLTGEASRDIFGYTVKGIGDVNGDGYEDIAVAGHFFAAANSGRVYIFHGSASGIASKPASQADAIISGTYTWNHLGYFIVKELGDINNDGFDDIMVSGDDQGATVKGHVYIFFGSPAGIGTQNATAADIIFEGSANGTRFGEALAGGKDINNDGFLDLVIDEAVTGKVYIYYGTASGWNAAPDITISNSAPYFGNRLKLIDINQDYFTDILIGSNYYKNDSSAVYIVYGNSNLSGGDIENIYGEKYVTEKSFYHESDGLDVYVNNDKEINLVIPNGIYDNYKGKVSFYNTCRIYNPSVLLKINNVQNNEIPQSSFLTVYPNPNDGNMQVDYEIPESEVGIFKIYDVIGRKLLSYSLNGGKNTFAISGNTLDKGIYFYQATAGNKRIGMDKIVVIK